MFLTNLPNIVDGEITMTLSEIQESTKEFLTPKDIAEVIGCHPYSINVQARQDITKLGFPASLIGTRLRIPRKAFLNWMNTEKEK